MTGNVSAMRVPGRGGACGGTRGCLTQRDELEGRSMAPRTSSRNERLGGRLPVIKGNMCSHEAYVRSR